MEKQRGGGCDRESKEGNTYTDTKSSHRENKKLSIQASARKMHTNVRCRYLLERGMM